MNKVFNPIALSFLLTIVACADEPLVEEGISTETTQAVIDHHFQAFLANDIEDLMSDYTNDSRLFAPDGAYVGLDEIRGAFEGFFAAFPAASVQITPDLTSVDGEVFYLTYHAESDIVDVPFGSDTFIVVDGKILTQTVAAVINPKQQ